MFCRYSDRKNTDPNMAKNTAAATTFAAVNVGMRKKERGSMGDSRCDSMKKKIARSAADSPKPARINGSLHPRALPSIRA